MKHDQVYDIEGEIITRKRIVHARERAWGIDWVNWTRNKKAWEKRAEVRWC